MLKLTSRRTRGRQPATWHNQGGKSARNKHTHARKHTCVRAEKERERSCCKSTICSACFHSPHHPLIWTRFLHFSFWHRIFINSILLDILHLRILLLLSFCPYGCQGNNFYVVFIWIWPWLTAFYMDFLFKYFGSKVFLKSKYYVFIIFNSEICV